MSELCLCDACGRHFKAVEDRCPFCERPAASVARAATSAVAVALTVTVGMTLSACYGGPPRRDNLSGGGSRDGWTAAEAGPGADPAPADTKTDASAK